MGKIKSEREFSWLSVYVPACHTVSFWRDVLWYSNLGNENFYVGQIKCSRGPHLARGPQVPHPCSTD